MGANQKEAVAALHRERMLAAAEELFQQKGFEQTTIDDISKASGYSRRTLYAYYVNKEDFLRQIVRKGLRQLDGALEAAVGRKTFEIRYFAAWRRRFSRYSHSGWTAAIRPWAKYWRWGSGSTSGWRR